MAYAARILVPADFSPSSALALEHAIALASLCRASIHLMHVRADGSQPTDGNETRLLSLVSRCCAEGITVTAETYTGQPAATITQVAADRAVDLIVIGTHAARVWPISWSEASRSKLCGPHRTPFLPCAAASPNACRCRQRALGSCCLVRPSCLGRSLRIAGDGGIATTPSGSRTIRILHGSSLIQERDGACEDSGQSLRRWPQ